MRKYKNFILISFGLFILLITYIAYVIFLQSALNIKEPLDVFINEGDDYAVVKEKFAPYLNSPKSFEMYSTLKKYPELIKQGYYRLEPGMSVHTLITKLRSGDQDPVKVVFNFAKRTINIAGQVSEFIRPDSIAILEAIRTNPELAATGETEEQLKHYFIPNTYEMYWTTTAEEFVDRMIKEYHAFWNGDRSMKAEKLNMTPLMVSSLAAIVQSETAKKDERPRVAGLYLNRLRDNIKLQADPTIIYCIQQEKGFDFKVKRVLYRDLEIDSPFNTYKYYGVPPAPIRVPDISSIDAVLNAEKHDYIFMCASTVRIGYHEFAKDGASHERNRKLWQAYLDAKGINR